MIFMGTGPFAARSLAALLEKDHTIVAVYTKPRGTVGRGRRTAAANPVRDLANARGIPIEDPSGPLREEHTLARLAAYTPDLIVVASYGKILPQSVLDLPRYGCVNVHASLLPRWRGATPIHAALAAGDPVTGVTIMQMDAGLDTGPVLAQCERVIEPDMGLGDLFALLAEDGAVLLAETLPKYLAGDLAPHPQPDTGVTVCRMLTRDDGHVDWAADAATIARRSRAYEGWPGTYTLWESPHGILRIKLPVLRIAQTAIPSDAAPGTVLCDGTVLHIVCGDGHAVAARTAQIEGRRAMTAAEIVAGHPALCGARLS